MLWAWWFVLRFSGEATERKSRLIAAGIFTGIALLMSQKAVLIALCLALLVERAYSAVSHSNSRVCWSCRWVFLSLAFAPSALFALILWCGGWLGNDGARVLFSGSLFVARDDGVLISASRSILASVFLSNLLYLWIVAFLFIRRFTTKSRWDLGNFGAASIFGISVVQVAVQHVVYYQILVLPLAALAVLSGQLIASLPPRRGVTLLAAGLLLCLFSSPWTIQTESRKDQLNGLLLAGRLEPGEGLFLDTMTGMGTYRPIFARNLYYRPFLYTSEFIDRHLTPEVLRNLQNRRFVGVGIDSALVSELPIAVRKELLSNYRPHPDHPKLWVPINTPAGGAP